MGSRWGLVSVSFAGLAGAVSSKGLGLLGRGVFFGGGNIQQPQRQFWSPRGDKLKMVLEGRASCCRETPAGGRKSSG